MATVNETAIKSQLRNLKGGSWFELTNATVVEEVGTLDEPTRVFLEICACIDVLNDELGGKYDGLMSEEAKKAILSMV